MKLGQWLQWQAETGEPIVVGETTITPQARALTIRWPKGGYVWSRPVAILVDKDGETERVPILDVTRDAQWGLYGLAAAVVFLVWLVRRFSR